MGTRKKTKKSAKQTKKKKVVTSHPIESGKSIPETHIQREHFPSWHFSSIDWDGNWGWNNLTLKDYRVLIDWMKDIECLNWGEILNQSSSRNSRHHKMDRGKLCNDARSRLTEINQDDVDEVFSFRLSGKQRLWGIVEKNVFKILWWDPEHTVYPVSKRGT